MTPFAFQEKIATPATHKTITIKMKTRHIFLFLISTNLSGLQAQNDLPADSAELLAKLQSFEEKEIAKAQEIIAEKTTAVVEVLRTHLERETRSGELETAVALKEQIEKMATTTLTSEKLISTPPGKDMNPKTEEIESFFIGPVWRNSGNGILTFQFESDGTGIKKYKGVPQEFTWILDDRRISVEIPSNGSAKVFSVFLPENEFWEVSATGEKLVEFDSEE